MANKLKDRLMARTANLAEKVEAAAADRPSIADQRPMTMPGQLGAFRLEAQRYQRQIDELAAELEKARKSGAVIEIPLDLLVEVPGRRRALTPEQKIELRENLRHNKLTHPITVRPLPDGRFEVISGHNRTDQYRELRRDKISAVPIEMSDAEASASAFYANLLQSDLSDYEKFVGFQDLLERTGKTQAEIAADSGISENTLSRLMAFVDLPPTAIEIIRTVPHCIGSSAVSQLGAIAREGKADAVLNAVKALAEGRVTQDAAVRMARDGEVRVKATRPTPVSIKSGKTTYCTVIAANKTLRIDFKTEEARAAVEEAVKKILSEFAAGDR